MVVDEYEIGDWRMEFCPTCKKATPQVLVERDLDGPAKGTGTHRHISKWKCDDCSKTYIVEG